MGEAMVTADDVREKILRDDPGGTIGAAAGIVADPSRAPIPWPFRSRCAGKPATGRCGA
jgi:hypothetical protein